MEETTNSKQKASDQRVAGAYHRNKIYHRKLLHSVQYVYAGNLACETSVRSEGASIFSRTQGSQESPIPPFKFVGRLVRFYSTIWVQFVGVWVKSTLDRRSSGD